MSQNHNQQPTTPNQLSREEQGLYTMQKLNEWRTRQFGILSALRANSFSVTDSRYVDEFNTSIDETLDDYLQSQGIDQTSPNYTEIRSLYRDASIDRINENEWGNSPASRGTDPSNHQSQSDIFAERVMARVGSSTTANPADNPDHDTRGEMTDELWREAYTENARFDVNGAREKWAAASAKRQGRAFTMKDKERDAIRDDYHAKVQKLGIMELDGQISDADDETTKNAKVIEFLFNEQKKLRELTTEKLSDTKISRFVEWMNAGSKLKRLGKAALIGVGAAGGAALFGLLAVPAGLAAGVAGGVGAAAAGTARFVRGFARGDRNRGMDIADVALVDDSGNHWNPLDDASHDNLEAKFAAAHTEYNRAFEEDTKSEQSKRRKAIGAGVLMTAVGTGAGLALSHAADLSGEWHDFWNGPNGSSPTHKPEVGKWGLDNDFDGDGIQNGVDLDKDGDGVLNIHDYKPHNPNVWDKPDVPQLENRYFEWHIDPNGVQQDNAADVFHDLLGYDTKAVTPEWLSELANDAGVSWTPGNTLVHQGYLNDPSNEQLKQMLEFAKSNNIKP